MQQGCQALGAWDPTLKLYRTLHFKAFTELIFFSEFLYLKIKRIRNISEVGMGNEK
jgi:hypothetical protein